MLLEDLALAPPLGAVELGDDPRAVGELDLVDAVLERIQGKADRANGEAAGLDRFAAGAQTALASFDQIYPQPSGESALQQLAVQLATPRPYDLETTDLSEYRGLHPRWHDWARVSDVCARIATELIRGL